MPRSKTFLIDANVWPALASERHDITPPAGPVCMWLIYEHQSGYLVAYAYLATFAVRQSSTLVTFDRGFRRWTQLVLLLLAR